MSDHPPKTSSIVLVDQPDHPILVSTTSTATRPSSPSREYRKGNWTPEETRILINAKKLDDERRARSSAACGDSKPQCKTPELRWKWVENYCWNNGCLRSQNQCNDKWDNLLRDYKKVRDYENRPSSSFSSEPTEQKPSYWEMDKHERKERNLPSNLLLQVYQALHEVVSRRPALRSPAPDAPAAAIAPPPPPSPSQQLPPAAAAAPSQPPLQPPIPEGATVSSETEESEKSDRRKRKSRSLGSSVVQSADVLARTLMACEERRDRRHQNVLEIEERKLRMEENRTQMNRQGFAGLATAVNNLSTAVHALASDRTDSR